MDTGTRRRRFFYIAVPSTTLPATTAPLAQFVKLLKRCGDVHDLGIGTALSPVELWGEVESVCELSEVRQKFGRECSNPMQLSVREVVRGEGRAQARQLPLFVEQPQVVIGGTECGLR